MKRLCLKVMRKFLRNRNYSGYDFLSPEYQNEEGNKLIFNVLGG